MGGCDDDGCPAVSFVLRRTKKWPIEIKPAKEVGGLDQQLTLVVSGLFRVK